MRSGTPSRRITERADGCSTPRTVARRHAPVGAAPSVTLVALFEPRVAEVVVTVALPETLLVVLQQREPGDPLGALPEVQVRDEQPHRPAVLAGQRAPLVRPDDPRLPAADVLQRQGRGVPGRGRGEHEPRLRRGRRRIEQHVHGDPAEAGVELRPRRDAVDVALVLRLRQRVKVGPAPGVLVVDEAVDGHRPAVGIESRGHLGGQDREVLARVVLAGWEPRVALGVAPADEASGSHGMSLAYRDASWGAPGVLLD